jgi:hypothetical protein
MQRGSDATRQTKKRQVRFPGLLNAAHALGVHRNHLYLVLSGKRPSASLSNRYQEYLKTKHEH